jgi:cell division protein FtsQ
MSIRTTRKTGNRRLNRSSAADYLLEVSTKSSSAKRRKRQKIQGWIFKTIFLVLLAGAAFYGAREAFDRFFYSNPDYTLTRIDLELDNVLTREEALEATGLREGANIFSVDLAAVEKILRTEPMASDVRIERILPDRIAVKITSRIPVAWIAPEGETGDPSMSPNALLADSDGILMRPRRVLPEHIHLPVIYGVKSDNIRQGEPLHSEDLRLALLLLTEVAARPESLLRIRSLDISRGYRIDVINDQNARIFFSTAEFGEQLDRLQKLLLHCAETGRTLDTVNLMVRRNTPVTFVMATAPVIEEPAPTTKPRKTSKN